MIGDLIVIIVRPIVVVVVVSALGCGRTYGEKTSFVLRSSFLVIIFGFNKYQLYYS